jgi:glycosyltransferase involved in cell wall biosynthesis
MKLAIISLTEHLKDNDGSIIGWGPTIREINELSGYFEKIIHIAPVVSKKGSIYSDSFTPYKYNNITFIPLKPSGGSGLRNKLGILFKIPANLLIIHTTLKQADWIQVRLPASIGIYVLPYLSMVCSKPRWVKYAGNWVEKKPPLSYKFQRWWLKHNYQNSMVTVNGKWPESGHHILPFENPCLNESDEELADKIRLQKKFNKKLTLLFVGRIEAEKGIFRVLDAIESIKDASTIFSKLIIVGNGKDEELLQKKIHSFSLTIEYIGGATREDINKFYSEAHFFLLPSTASEGFPKVIAEAARFGVIPIVSNVSSIAQYVNALNGFVWDIEGKTDFKTFFSQIPFGNSDDLAQKSKAAIEIGKLFTYRKYYEKLCKYIFNITPLPDNSTL